MKGIGLLEAEDGKVNVPGTTDNPFMDQLIQCRISNPAVRQRMEELAAQEVYDACNGLPIIVHLEAMERELCFKCHENGYTVEALEEMYEKALFGKNTVSISQAFAHYCPRAKCLIDKFRNGAITSKLHTEICQKFEGEKNPTHLDITASTIPSNPSAYAYAKVRVQSDGTVYHEIKFNQANCNNSSINNLEILETFFHELLHVEINRKLIELGLSPNDINNTTLKSAKFISMVTSEYGPNAPITQHEYMLSIFLEKMVNSIREANGGIGLYEDYLGLVLFGFGEPADITYLQSLGYSSQDVITLYNRYKSFINGGTIYSVAYPPINSCN